MMKRSVKGTKKAFTLVEVIVVLALIGILSTMLGVYVISSSKVGNTIKKDYDAVSESRIAMSYMMTLIQQNDRSNAIKLDDSKKLKVETQDESGKKTEVVVYYDSTKGKLMEQMNGKDNEIAQIASYDIKYNNIENGNVAAAITIEVGYKDIHNNNNIKKRQQEISIRSENF